MRILLTGSTGQLGWELKRTLSFLGDVIAPTRDYLDLQNIPSLREKVLSAKPDWIVNPAAYTAVDRAEQEPELCALINTQAPHALALVAQELGIPFIHYSTDYVFNGQGDKPWTEEDPAGPLNTYGRTKREGEVLIQDSCEKHLIFRTSWVCSTRGSNFFLKIQELAKSHKELRIVEDQKGAPTWARDLAQATALVMAQMFASSEGRAENRWGLYHMTNQGETSWYGFARSILSLTHPDVRILPIPSSEFPTPALRPKNSRLSNAKLQRNFGIELPRWEEGFI